MAAAQPGQPEAVRLRMSGTTGPFRFCPRCAAPLRRRRDADGHARLTCRGCGHILYLNSKTCAGAVIVEAGRVLLVRRAAAPARGWWDIPGGFLEAGELPEVGARREVLEETGLEVRILGLLGIFADRYRFAGINEHVLNIFYLAEPAGGKLRVGSDVTSAGWFQPSELPRRIAFAANRKALEVWRGLVYGAASPPAVPGVVP